MKRLPRITRLLLAGGLFTAALGFAPLTTAFQQLPDDPSPEGGSAQVVAQGVTNIPETDLRWQISRRSAPLPANAGAAEGALGFILVESGVLLVEDRETGQQQRLAAGEAMLTQSGSQQVRAALGSDTATYLELTLTDAAAEAIPEGAELTFSSEPFAGLGARHDFELLQDTLAPGATMAIPSGAIPALIAVVQGSAQVQTEAGDVLPVNAGESVALAGPVIVTAAENGANVAATFAGPAVPQLAQAQAVGTPAAGGRVIEPPTAEAPAATATIAAEPAVVATPEAASPDTEAATDEDGDGLSAVEESELNTDPALADTDEDGLTDGQEVIEFGTAPLAPDTDQDGVLDGDEVAQGTDPLGTGEVPQAEAPAEAEAPPAEGEAPPAAEAGAVGDSDGDGLEDEIEISLGTDPADADTDDDGASDGDEYYVHQTGTRNPDTDADGVFDGDEVANGTDPNDPTSF